MSYFEPSFSFAKAINDTEFLSLPVSAEIAVNTSRYFVTYEFSGGRFGDNLIAYLHAKWISYKYGIPMLYKPFEYSSDLMLDELEIPYAQISKPMKQLDFFKSFNSNYYNLDQAQTIYIVPYFPESKWEREVCKGGDGNIWPYFRAGWEDPDFRKLCKKFLQPKENYSLVKPPSDCINIAIHYREGGGYDYGDFALGFLTKFPSLDFYVQGLLKIIRIFDKQPLYCYLFTDARNPLDLVDKIKSKIPPETNIFFDFRSVGNSHDKNVLEDFFSLFNFDVLIHAESNFSMVPALLHPYSIIYRIASAHLEGRTPVIDKVYFRVDEKRCKERITEIVNLNK
jgi:hypothetical protein